MSVESEYKFPRATFWVRWVLAVLTGALIAILVSGYSDVDDDRAGCERNSHFKAIVAEFLDSSASFRSHEGNHEAAAHSQALGDAVRKTIPYPSDLVPKEKRGERAEKRKQGCEDAYHPPIPFIE